MNQPSTPFDTIESAHEFFELLSATIADAKQEVTSDVKRERTDGDRRRLEALRVAVYNLERLEYHLTRSKRILNDLRTLRRLLLQERLLTPSKNAFPVPANGGRAHAAD
ncbi:MAG: hypothetical protein ACRD3E_01700 [Terriglobales bacterium]